MAVAFQDRTWSLAVGQRLTVGRGSACQVRLPDDVHLSRYAGMLTVLDDCVLVRNVSRSKPLVLRPSVGEDRVVEPQAATTSLPFPQFAVVFAGQAGAAVAVAVDARTLAPPQLPDDARSRTTLATPVVLTPGQRRVLVSLCEPLLIRSGPQAAPATYAEIGHRLGRQPQYVRNVIKSIRETLSGHGIAGLAVEQPEGSHHDFRWELARWSVRSGWVDATDLRDLPPS